ncbi:EthD domain-containing protein [Mycolicibacterium sp. P1-18]|uniref:EthD domain-containing protein n=1 Tax=Mycolicibacterium sp. P1-18 TaxID=2024615 RepID=UPI001565E6D5|nr:EthD domain-containing protein [Mycolicibacterium sp. P1-18]
MFKVLSYLAKRDGMATEEFVDYYENHHVPLILSVGPVPTVYKRHYLHHGDAVDVGAGEIDFDVVTEVAFPDRSAFTSWMEAVGTGDVGDRVAADEARFLDRSRTRACVVHDYVTTRD